MTERMVFRSARLIDPSQGLDEIGDLLLENGAVAAVGGRIEAPGAEETDARGMALLPGLVDMHVHLRDPGFTQKEDLFSGCRAAAAGGVTSLLAMPNTNPAMGSPALVRDLLRRAEAADARVYVAAAITKGLESRELCGLRALREAGAVAVSDDGRPVTDSRLMAQALQQAPALGLRVTAHCEDLSLARGGLMNEGAVSRELGVPGIPAAAEDCGTARDLVLAKDLGAPLHVCHVSTAASVGMIRAAKAAGVRVTAETCPHYLLLTEEALRARNADFRMNPPLRTEQDRRALLAALQDGTLDAIATDHAPHTPEEKADFLHAPNGSIGMETSLAACYTALVAPGLMSLSALVEKMSCAPARILGIPGGTLRVGAPADAVLFDPQETWVVDPARLHGKSRNTPFAGMRLQGRVRMTVCRGRTVYRAD